MSLKIVVMSFLTFLGFSAIGQNSKKAEAFFKAGKFTDAQTTYSAVLEKDPDNLQALIYMGYISLLSNKLVEAESWLMKAKTINPKQPAINEFMAEVWYRRKDFQKASPYFRAMGREGMAKKLESFDGQIPYEVDPNFNLVTIKFIVTEPLPFVRVIINEKHEGNFILDTGGGELILDTEFAKEASSETFGNEAGSEFGGGKTATLTHGKISTISLGNLIINNVPVNILPMRHIELAGLKIDGVIGTVFLYQFLSTIDYRNKQLVLRSKEKYTLDSIDQKSAKSHRIPFTMAGDHFMLSDATINGGIPMLFFIDTGLAGMAFTCPKSTLEELKIHVQKSKKSTGMGGGGVYDIYPFDLEQICLGDACIENLHGQYGPFPPQIENSFGFKINGLLSHEFFKNYSVTIDFSEMKYLLSAN